MLAKHSPRKSSTLNTGTIAENLTLSTLFSWGLSNCFARNCGVEGVEGVVRLWGNREEHAPQPPGARCQTAPRGSPRKLASTPQIRPPFSPVAKGIEVDAHSDAQRTVRSKALKLVLKTAPGNLSHGLNSLIHVLRLLRPLLLKRGDGVGSRYICVERSVRKGDLPDTRTDRGDHAHVFEKLPLRKGKVGDQGPGEELAARRTTLPVE